MKKITIIGFISLLMMVSSIFYTYYSLVPHDISDLNTSLDKFSSARAMVHIENMTKELHFVGTPYHKIVRNYIIDELHKLGLKTEVQKQFSLNEKWRGATNNYNILTRIKGKERGKALMLLSHYDSAPPASKGASDDAVGVAAILESVRAFLVKGEKPKHDIIILITDGEEIGLVGAKAFLEHHRWAKDVGLVINFEARGSGGPSYTLLETNGGNKRMVEEFVKADVSYPIANSFLYSVYKMLPNDTDLTMFREIGDIEGYNFAFIDDFYDYHTSSDNFENVDLSTVEHQGDYLMNLLNYFSHNDFEDLKSDEDVVFFNFLRLHIFSYSFSLVKPIFFLILFIFLLLIGFGLKSGRLSAINLLKSIGLFTVSIILSIVLVYFGWKFIVLLHPSYSDILHGFPYNGHYYIAGFSFLILALITYLYNSYSKRLNFSEIIIAPILFWLILNGVFAYMLMGASFMILPSVFALILLGIDLSFNLNLSTKVILYTAISLPGLIIVSPFIDMFPVGLRMVSLPVSAIFIVLSFILVYPIIKLSSINKIFAKRILIFSIFILGLAELNSGFNLQSPKPNSINYMNYIDSDKAFWETYTNVLDDWLIDIMGNKIEEGRFGGVSSDSKYKTKITFHSEANKIDLAVPKIEKVQDVLIDGFRNIEVNIVPQRKVHRINIVVTNDVEFESIWINGIKYSENSLVYTASKRNIVSYYITEDDESLNLRFSYDLDFKPEILIYEISYDLLENKELSVSQRPKELVPMPFIINDAVVNIKKLEF